MGGLPVAGVGSWPPRVGQMRRLKPSGFIGHQITLYADHAMQSAAAFDPCSTLIILGWDLELGEGIALTGEGVYWVDCKDLDPDWYLPEAVSAPL
jgi:hypothetical protein